MKHRFSISLASLALAASVSFGAGFGYLFQVEGLKGTCQVREPGAVEFKSAIKGKAYPYGTTVRTLENSAAALRLSEDYSLDIAAGTTLVPMRCEDSPDTRHLNLQAGRMTLFTTADGGDSLVVQTPVVDCTDFKGRSEFSLAVLPDSYDLSVQVASGGTATLLGPQFSIPDLKSGYRVRIRTLKDRSYTRILNTLGDYAVLIDNGNPEPVSIATVTRSAIKIWREHAPVGGREIVSVLAIGPDGKGRERFAFAVGQPLVASLAPQTWVEEAEGAGEEPDQPEEADAEDGETVDFDAAFGTDGDDEAAAEGGEEAAGDDGLFSDDFSW
ncbi:MAG: hypothetical protein ACOX5G_13855 [Kiritimatiellia bacterium]|jgi:hypothetical protein